MPVASQSSTKRFGYVNETVYDGRTVGKIVRWVFRYLEVERYPCYVKVKHHNGFHAYQGRFYGSAHQGAYVWDRRVHDYRLVETNVPSEYSHLIVCRIGKPGLYPVENHVYQRIDTPGTWMIEDWQEALVSVLAHEAMHLRQKYKNAKRGNGYGGKYNEIETEWAAYRLCMEWRLAR